jgi:hypothetical protein
VLVFLTGIIGNILTAPQVEADELTPQLGVFCPADMVAAVVQVCRMGCAAASGLGGARIYLEAPQQDPGDSELAPLVEGDRHRLEQVLQNLVNPNGPTVSGCVLCLTRLLARASSLVKWAWRLQMHASSAAARQFACERACSRLWLINPCCSWRPTGRGCASL